MKKEDREYFSSQLHRLADTANKAFAAIEGYALKNEGPSIKEAMAPTLKSLKKLTREFADKGYSNLQWNRLLTSSGVAAKMHPHGGAFKMLTPKQAQKLDKKMAAYLKKRGNHR